MTLDEDIVAATRPEATWHRLSPRMLLIHPITELVRALPALAGIVLAGHSGGHGALTGLGIAVLVALLAVSRWFTTRLRITDEQVELRHGLLRRRTIATRRGNIRTVDVTAHVLHRALGLARVVVGTGTSDRKGGGRIVLDGLPRNAASTLRDELLHRTSAAASGARSTATIDVDEPLHEIARLDRHWIGYAPFTLSGVVTGLIIWGFFWRLQGESGIDLLHSGPLRAVGRALDRMPTPLAVLLITASLVVFVAVTSTVGYVLSFWNFRLRRHDGGTLQVTRGLITTRATSIERSRLAGAEVSETLLLRSVGGARALAVATGLRVGRGAERGGEVLLPPAPLAVAQRVATAVLDGSPAVRVDLVAHGVGARRRRFTRALAGGAALVAAAAAGYVTGGSVWPIPIAVLALAACIPLARDRYASLGHARSDGYLITRLGSIVRRRTVLAEDAVIGWNLRRSFFQRRLGLATLTATTAAGRQGYAVLDLPEQDAVALAESVTPGLLHQFLAMPRTPSRLMHDSMQGTRPPSKGGTPQ